MKTLYWYITKEIATVAAATVGVLTALLVLVNAFRDIFDLLLNTDISLWTIIHLIFLLVPFVLTFTVPWGLLMSVLLVFGRMSQDRELLALKTNGVGVAPIIAPAICLSLVCSLFCFWINAQIGPRCRQAFQETGYRVISQNPLAFFVPGQPITKFSGYRIWVAKRNGNSLEDVYIWQLNANGVAIRSIRADRGELKPDMRNLRLVITLFNARQEERSPVNPSDIKKIDAGGRAQEMPLEISMADVFDRYKDRRSVGESTMGELQDDLFSPMRRRTDTNMTPLLTELQKRIAWSFSCFTFVLIGIPLAIQTGRRETSIGVALSLGVVLAYYFIVIIAESLKKNADAYPEIIIWAPNFIFQVLGFGLLWKVNQK